MPSKFHLRFFLIKESDIRRIDKYHRKIINKGQKLAKHFIL